MKRFVVLIYKDRSGFNTETTPYACYTFREGASGYDVQTIEQAEKAAVKEFKKEHWFINPENYVVVAYQVKDDPHSSEDPDNKKWNSLYKNMARIKK